jgi:hypothetical protein
MLRDEASHKTVVAAVASSDLMCSFYASPVQFSLDDSSATVQLGETRVLAVISAELEAPYQDRSREGTIK